MAKFQAQLIVALLAWAAAGPALAQMEPDPREEELPLTDPDPPEDPDVAPPRPPPSERDRPLMLRLGATRIWDSNVLHSPDARSERIGAYYIGASVDKPYAQQRFRLEATASAYRYDNFSYLDFEALNYLGTWTWQFTPRIGGALSATRTEELADYSDFRNPGVLNVRTTETFLASADAWVFGGWHLTGGLTRLQNRYSVAFTAEGNYRADGFEAGVRWVARSANYLGFNLRSLDGRYERAADPVAQLDDGFERREAEALALWRLGGKLLLDGRLAHVEYRSNNFAERDFSGIAGGVRAVWAATGRLALNAQFARTIEPWSETRASHRVDGRLTIGAAWEMAARTTLRLDASRTDTDFRDPLPGFAGALRRDVLRTVQLEAEWRALRNLSLKAAVQRYEQSSNDAPANYRGNLVSLGLSLLL